MKKHLFLLACITLQLSLCTYNANAQKNKKTPPPPSKQATPQKLLLFYGNFEYIANTNTVTLLNGDAKLPIDIKSIKNIAVLFGNGKNIGQGQVWLNYDISLENNIRDFLKKSGISNSGVLTSGDVSRGITPPPCSKIEDNCPPIAGAILQVISIGVGITEINTAVSGR